jgi:hypothetical protein
LRDYYEPQNRRPLLFQDWKLDLAYFRAVQRAPVGLGTKAILWAHLARRMAWDRKKLARELAHAVQWLRPGHDGRRS